MAILLAAALLFCAEHPDYLFKVTTVENWEASQSQATLKLDASDDEFIHFSLANQVERITSKYWKNVPEFVILQIDPDKLEGKLVFEANPGGTSKYYHLYNGSIPLDSVVEAKVVTQR
jgi:uncharacterized protein (DUF952 family)